MLKDSARSKQSLADSKARPRVTAGSKPESRSVEDDIPKGKSPIRSQTEISPVPCMNVETSHPLPNSQSMGVRMQKKQALQSRLDGSSSPLSNTTTKTDPCCERPVKPPSVLKIYGSRHQLTQSSVLYPQASISSSIRGLGSSTPVGNVSKKDDQLQVAAQIVPWAYMLHTLDETFKEAELQAHSTISQKSQEITAKELKMSDKRTRAYLERLISLYDELAENKAASGVVMTLLTQGEECAKLTAQALQLARSNKSCHELAYPLLRINVLLQQIGDLREQLYETAESTKELASTRASNLGSILQDCLPLLDARSKNLDTSFTLVQTIRDNALMSLQLETMRTGTREKQ